MFGIFGKKEKEAAAAPAKADPAAPRLSVVVPIYNAQKHIEKLITNLKAQNYPNLEVVLVDDGSTDDSGKICDALAGKNTFIRVIHKENGGVSSARNAGILAATGEYIHFCDADDSLEAGCYQDVVGRMESAKADCAFFGWYVDIVSPDGSVNSVSQSDNCPDGVGDQDEIFRTMLIMSGSAGGKEGFGNYVWNKMVRRSSLKDAEGNTILFDEKVSIAEDGLWLVQAAQNWKTGVFCRKPYYHYLRNEESVMNTPANYDRTRLASQESHKRMLAILRAYNPKYFEIHKATCIEFFWVTAKSAPEKRNEQYMAKVITNIVEINDGICPERITKDILWHMRQTQINRRKIEQLNARIDELEKKH